MSDEIDNAVYRYGLPDEIKVAMGNYARMDGRNIFIDGFSRRQNGEHRSCILQMTKDGLVWEDVKMYSQNLKPTFVWPDILIREFMIGAMKSLDGITPNEAFGKLNAMEEHKNDLKELLWHKMGMRKEES